MSQDKEIEIWQDSPFVEFSGRACAYAGVAWVNPDWLRSLGVDQTDANQTAKFHEWIIRSFSVMACEDKPSPSDGLVLRAERYGATGLAPNGGSGRACVIDGYAVKGVGRTPLVGTRADWNHSHGCLFLEEALREAIFSLRLHDLCPAYVEPVLAIVDLRISEGAAHSAAMRRALLIRRYAERVAVFQRATFFRSFQNPVRAQSTDAARVKSEILKLKKRASNRQEDVQCEAQKIFTAVAESTSVLHLHRVFNGGLFSSNVSTSGRHMDFGSMRVLPSWDRSYHSDSKVAFGEELDQLKHIVLSVTFFIEKNLKVKGLLDTAKIWRVVLRSYATRKREHLRRMSIGLSSASIRSIELAARELSRQNRRAKPVSGNEPFVEKIGWSALTSRITYHMRNEPTEEADKCIARMGACLKQEHPLDRERVQEAILELLRVKIKQPEDLLRVSDGQEIVSLVSRTRRYERPSH